MIVDDVLLKIKAMVIGGQDVANLSRGINGLSQTLTGLNSGLQIVNQVAASLEKMAGAAKRWADEANKAETGTRVFEMTVRRFGLSTEDAVAASERLAKQFGLSSAEVQASMTTLIRAGFRDMGQLEKVMEGAAASSIAFGRTAAEGFERIGDAAVTGLSAALNSIGISENLGPALDKYAKSLGKTADELTDIERAQTLANLTLKATKTEVEALDSILNDYVRSQQAADLAQKELTKNLGQIFMPHVAKFNLQLAATTGLMLDMVKAFRAGQDPLDVLAAKFPQLAGPINTFARVFGNLTLAFNDVKVGAQDVFERTVQPVLERLQPMAQRTGEIVGSNLKKLVPVFQDIQQTASHAFEKVVMPLFEAVAPTVMAMVQAVMPLLVKLGQLLAETFKMWVAAWEHYALPLIERAAPVVGALVTAVGQILGSFIDMLRGWYRVIRAMFEGDWKGAWEGARDIVGNALRAIQNALDGLAIATVKALGNIADLVGDKIADIANKFSRFGSSLADKFLTGFLNIKAGMQNALADAIENAVKNLPPGVVNALKNIGIDLTGLDDRLRKSADQDRKESAAVLAPPAQGGPNASQLRDGFKKQLLDVMGEYSAKNVGGLVPVIHEGFRSMERQQALYNQGRTTAGPIVTNAKAGQSLHNYGVAADIYWRDPKTGKMVSFDDPRALEAAKALGQMANNKGLLWGGSPGFGIYDAPHIQENISWQQAKAKYGTQAPPVNVDITGNVQSAFEKVFATILQKEGGFQKDPNDRGNYANGKLIGTKYGISAAAYPTLDIPNLTIQQAKDIYYRDFWKKSGASGIKDAGLGLVHMDTAFHSGTGKAAELLKSSGGDVNKYLDQRLEFLKSLKNWDTYGAGWTKRIEEIRKQANQLSGNVYNGSKTQQGTANNEKAVKGYQLSAEKLIKALEELDKAQAGLNRTSADYPAQLKKITSAYTAASDAAGKRLKGAKTTEEEQLWAGIAERAQASLKGLSGAADPVELLTLKLEKARTRLNLATEGTAEYTNAQKNLKGVLEQLIPAIQKKAASEKDDGKKKALGDQKKSVDAELKALNDAMKKSDGSLQYVRERQQAILEGAAHTAAQTVKTAQAAYDKQIKGAGDNASRQLQIVRTLGANVQAAQVEQAKKAYDLAIFTADVQYKTKMEAAAKLGGKERQAAEQAAAQARQLARTQAADALRDAKQAAQAEQNSRAEAAKKGAANSAQELTRIQKEQNLLLLRDRIASSEQQVKVLEGQFQRETQAADGKAQKLAQIQKTTGAAVRDARIQAARDNLKLAQAEANEQRRIAEEQVSKTDPNRAAKLALIAKEQSAAYRRAHTEANNAIQRANDDFRNGQLTTSKAVTEQTKREKEAVSSLLEKYNDLRQALAKKAESGTLTDDDLIKYNRDLAETWEAAGKAGVKANSQLVTAHASAKAFGELAMQQGYVIKNAQETITDTTEALLNAINAAPAETQEAAQRAIDDLRDHAEQVVQIADANGIDALATLSKIQNKIDDLTAAIEKLPSEDPFKAWGKDVDMSGPVEARGVRPKETPIPTEAARGFSPELLKSWDDFDKSIHRDEYIKQLTDSLEGMADAELEAALASAKLGKDITKTGLYLGEQKRRIEENKKALEGLPALMAQIDLKKLERKVSTGGISAIDAANEKERLQTILENAQWEIEKKKLTGQALENAEKLHQQRLTEIQNEGIDERKAAVISDIDFKIAQAQRQINKVEDRGGVADYSAQQSLLTEKLAAAREELDKITVKSGPAYVAALEKVQAAEDALTDSHDRQAATIKRLTAEFFNAASNFFKTFGAENLSQITSGIGGIVDQLMAAPKTIENLKTSWGGLKDAMSSGKGIGSAIGGIFGALGGAINIVSGIAQGVMAVGDAIENLSPSIQKWKKGLTEVAQLQKEAAGSKSYNGVSNPYFEALQKDASEREKMANSKWWQRLGWSLFGNGPKMMEEGKAKTLAAAGKIFDELASGLMGTFEDSIMNAWESGDWGNVEQAISKSLNTYIAKTVLQTVLAQSKIADFIKAYADARAAGKDGQVELEALRAELAKVTQDARTAMDGLPSDPAEKARKEAELARQYALSVNDIVGQALELQYNKGLLNTEAYEQEKLKLALERIRLEMEAELAAENLTEEQKNLIRSKFSLQTQQAQAQFQQQQAERARQQEMMAMNNAELANEYAYKAGLKGKKEYEEEKLRLTIARINAEIDAELAKPGLSDKDKQLLEEKRELLTKMAKIPEKAAETSGEITGLHMGEGIDKGLEQSKAVWLSTINGFFTDMLNGNDPMKGWYDRIRSQIAQAVESGFMVKRIMGRLAPLFEQLNTALEDGANPNSIIAKIGSQLPTVGLELQTQLGPIMAQLNQSIPNLTNAVKDNTTAVREAQFQSTTIVSYAAPTPNGNLRAKLARFS